MYHEIIMLSNKSVSNFYREWVCLKACLHCAIVSKGMCLQQNYNPNPIMQIKSTAIANQF